MSEETNKNLIPFNELTQEEQRKIASKGGKASVKARRKNKLLKELLKTILDTAPQLDNKTKTQLIELGFTEEDLTNRGIIIAAMVKQARKGDMRAAEKIFEMTGEHIAKQIVVNEEEIAKAEDTLIKIRETIDDRG